jgi:transposase-like protein
MYLWRVDHEGGVLEILVQRRRDKRAAIRLMRKLLYEITATGRLSASHQAISASKVLTRRRLEGRFGGDR